jgi:N-acetylglucosaminyl-diphospho-decaprenol L-rhamnosyltransferase
VASVDVVVVTFNSGQFIGRCTAPFQRIDWVNVIVVDNGSDDQNLLELPDTCVIQKLPTNVGFARAANIGWRSGRAPFVLFLNPDAAIDAPSLKQLIQTLDENTHAAAVGPRISSSDGRLEWSQGRFPTLVSAYAQLVGLHRLLPRAPWACEDVMDPRCYRQVSTPDWLVGACLLVRRSDLQAMGGFDERFFLYCEDVDLCARLRATGREILFEPRAHCVHRGQGSGPRSLALLTQSRLRLAEKHSGMVTQGLVRLALALRAASRLALTGDAATRRRQRAALRVCLAPRSRTETRAVGSL